jgi:excisionase family DNA binding protein
MSAADPLAVLDQIPISQVPGAIAKLASRMMVTATEPADALLTPDETARLLRVSRKAVYNRARELGAVRIGRALRFSRARVLRYLERRRQ